jgi:hypothetical protein
MIKMETRIINKNEIRCSLIDLYYGLIKILDEPNKETKLKDFKKILKNLTNDIKTKYRDSVHKDIIRKIFKEEINNFYSLAQEVIEGNSFINGKFTYDLFDGIPVTKNPIFYRKYDLVIKTDPTRSKAWVFAPSIEDEFDPLATQIQAEQDFGIPCVDIKIHREYTGRNSNISNKKKTIIKNTQTSKKILKIKPKISNHLGKVLFSKKDQFILRAENYKDEIKGFLFEDHIHTVKPLDVLVLENQEAQKKIYANVAKIDMNPLSGGGYVSKFSELVTHVLFRPLMEVSNDWKGRVRPCDLTDFVIRKPSDKELVEVLNVPENGLPIGRLDYDGSNEVFRYPLEPKDTIYQSLMIAGVQGKGKTNALKLIIRSLVTNSKIESSKRPAIVILDGEGEYKEFTKKSQMLQISQEFLDKNEIGDVTPKVYTINNDPMKSDSTLSLRGIDRQDLIYLLPELESKTENILRVLINRVCNMLDNEKAPQDIDTMRNKLLAENNNSQLIHMQQRPAIARAVLSPSLNLLDQKGKIPLTPHLLFKPGTVSVINYQGLDQNMKRVVALYLLQMLDKYKMNEPNYDPGVLLVIDEAELLFPENPSKGDKDYVLRIAARMEDITNRGRKRKYGVALVTHLPSEVSHKVGDLANTKIAFGCSGADKWIRDHFGRDYVTEINSFPTGICRIVVKVNTNKQGPINARVGFPYVGDKEALSDIGGGVL